MKVSKPALERLRRDIAKLTREVEALVDETDAVSGLFSKLADIVEDVGEMASTEEHQARFCAKIERALNRIKTGEGPPPYCGEN